MKKIFTLFLLSFVAQFAFSQCQELFISEYVEGYGNNRALELYNPTASTINLNQYSVGRFDNGGVTFQGVQIPAGNTIKPYSTYVIALDKNDPKGTGLEIPIWDGYQKWGVCIDRVTGKPIIGTSGDTIYCVQYDTTGVPLRDTLYHDFLDLKGKADIYLCPVYNTNKAMYFNGNDAVALVKGTDISADGGNVVDVVGVIGYDPGADGWKDADGKFLTKDKTLVRKAEIKKGTGLVFRELNPNLVLHDTAFNYSQWLVYGNNTFSKLRKHGCQCDPLYVGTQDIQTVDFKVYPNPFGVGQEITIESELRIDNVQVFNTLGQKVSYINLNLSSNSLKWNPTLMQGLYWMQIKFEDGSVTTKSVQLH